jgi:hypothetical protein
MATGQVHPSKDDVAPFDHSNPMVTVLAEVSAPAPGSHTTIAAPPGGSVTVMASNPASNATVIVVDDGLAPKAQKTEFHGSRLCTCSHFYTIVKEDIGTVAMDRVECCYLCGQARETADMAKVSFWRAVSSQGTCCCGRSGTILAHLDSTSQSISNRFSPPVTTTGITESYKVDEAMRFAQRKELGPKPLWMDPGVKEFTRAIGCCGIEHWLCRCWPLCDSRTHKLVVGPHDEVTMSEDVVNTCGRKIAVTGTSAEKVELATAARPVGFCGVTGSDPNWGTCGCQCTEMVDFVLDGDTDGAVALSVKRGSSKEVVAEVLDRVEHPSLGPEKMLQEYTDTHPCYGSKGKLTLTDRRVTFEGFKHPTHCCKPILPWLPNFCCWACQVHQISTAPLDRVYAVSVEGENPCSILVEAKRLLCRDLSRAMTLSVMGMLIWGLVALYRLVYCLVSPILVLICWPCRQTAINFKTRGGDISFHLRTPTDTSGMHMRDFAEHIVLSVRKAQQVRADLLRVASKDIVIGASKK